MYLLILLALLGPVWFLLKATVFRGDFLPCAWTRRPAATGPEGVESAPVDTWPLAVAAALLLCAGLLDELLLPAPFRWLTFVPARADELERAARWQHFLALLPATVLLASRRRRVGGRDVAVALALWMVTNATLMALLQINMRIDYPYDLEWMEGTMLDHTVVLRRGGALYQEPSPEYIPYLYGPLYHRIVALLPYVARSPYLPGRMVTLVATGIATLLIYGLATRSARDGWLGLLAALCLPASYSFVGTELDIHRVDATFVCFTLLGAALVGAGQARRSRLRLVAAGLCFSLAVFTKQIAGLAAVVAMLWLLLNHGWRSAFWTAAAGAAGGGLLIWLELASSGRTFFRYVIGLPWLIRPPKWVYFRNELVSSDLLSVAGFVLLVFLVDAALSRCRREGWGQLYRELSFGVAVALMAMTVMMRVRPGGWINCRLPFVAGGALALGLWLREHGRDWARLGIGALLLAGYTMSMDPFLEAGKRAIPSAEDLRAQRQLEAYLRGRPGRVLSIFHTHLSYSAKGQLSFHDLAVRDWTMAYGYPRAIVEAMQARVWSTIVSDVEELRMGPPEAQRAFREGYSCRRNPFRWGPRTGFPVVGYPTRPEFLCERRDAPAAR